MSRPEHPRVKCRSRFRGFTLIELVVTLVILGILAGAAVPFAQIAYKRRQESELRSALNTLRDALDAYKKAATDGRIVLGPLDSGYPPDLETLVRGVVDAKSPSGTKIFFLRRIPIDPMSDGDPDNPTAGWGLRSYESEATDPKPGADVFDVYSLSTGIGLNGIAYRDW